MESLISTNVMPGKATHYCLVPHPQQFATATECVAFEKDAAVEPISIPDQVNRKRYLSTGPQGVMAAERIVRFEITRVTPFTL